MDHVYVLDRQGKPLMPCRPRKARILLQANKAHIARHTPFTIQLDYDAGHRLQHVTLGVDAGSKTIGISASTDEHELLAMEFKPRNDVVNLLSTRRELRRSRRNRKTRYRKPRFNNRIGSKHKGWLAPSVETKIHNHLQAIDLVHKILPIDLIRIETAEFDLQRLKAMLEGKPIPVGTDYQLGEMYDQYNIRQYVLHRDGYTCLYCHTSKTKFHVHHLESRKTGSDRPDNLITLCESCHKKYHKGKISLDGIQKGRNYRDASFMGIMRKTLLDRVRRTYPGIPVQETHGYITKYIRESKKLLKSHVTDALCIANHPDAERTGVTYLAKPIRSHNRQIHKANPRKSGIRPRNQSAKTIHGFKLFDKVDYGNQTCFITGKRTTGYFMLKTIEGKTVTNSVSYKKLTLLQHSNAYIIDRKENAVPPHG
ncbi:RNA-guided endonuclease IscB [uncultured Alistipes sp.]|jgi:N6-L-threonylcarbamoyladenine synthase|uniref:RNA-guided endonuclease IscB n=1 Tax=uncultured Alistipes sp. TaxID=538949 RepID=UPI00272C0DA9|nr:RNA-guided endonuclease IscB [uncultured Alistipes sp.]